MTLDAEATSGFYFLEARGGEGPEGIGYGGVGVQVASYRKPEFELNVTPAASEVVQGDTVRVTIEAGYFSGGPLVDAPLNWRVSARPHTFQWQNAPAGRYFSFRPFDPDDFNYDPFRSQFFGFLAEGSGITDDDGRFVIELPAALSDGVQSQTWFFDATVQSPNNQFVGGGATVAVHRAAYTIGLSPRSTVVAEGEEALVDVITLDSLGAPDSTPYPGADLDFTVHEFSWNSVYERSADGVYRWRSEVQRTPLLTATVTTADDGRAEISWLPERGGQYQVEVRGRDENGFMTSSATYLWVSAGAEFVAWKRENHDRIELVADRERYAPGDTARILVPSPFTGPVDALVTLERDGVLETEIVTLATNSDVIEVPITVDHIPNIYLSVVIVKGVDATNPAPALRVGYIELPVETDAMELSLELEPSASVLRPGDVLSYTVTVRGADGLSVPDSEVSVALVDKAVLSLAQGDSRTLTDIFYARRPLGVTSSALLIINRDRQSQQLAEGAKGGGGGGDGGILDIREDFSDVAYWRADFVSDDRGQFGFTVTLPDSLTTWQLTARAVSLDSRVGDGIDEVVTTKELQIRPLLPRFFSAGDRARIGATVINAGLEALGRCRVTDQYGGCYARGRHRDSRVYTAAR